MKKMIVLIILSALIINVFARNPMSAYIRILRYARADDLQVGVEWR